MSASMEPSALSAPLASTLSPTAMSAIVASLPLPRTKTLVELSMWTVTLFPSRVLRVRLVEVLAVTSPPTTLGRIRTVVAVKVSPLTVPRARICEPTTTSPLVAAVSLPVM